MGLTNDRDHRISLDEASKCTSTYRKLYGAGPGALVTGVYSREAFDAILGQSGCQGIRYYGAVRPDGTPTLVFVGTDKEGNDLYQGVLIDLHWPCPPVCGAANPLNS